MSFATSFKVVNRPLVPQINRCPSLPSLSVIRFEGVVMAGSSEGLGFRVMRDRASAAFFSDPGR